MANRTLANRWYDFEPKLIAGLVLIATAFAGYLVYIIATAPDTSDPREKARIARPASR